MERLYQKQLIQIEEYVFLLTGNKQYEEIPKKLFLENTDLISDNPQALIGVCIYIGCIKQYRKVAQLTICKFIGIYEYRFRRLLKIMEKKIR